jgi:Holliday junction resolvase
MPDDLFALTETPPRRAFKSKRKGQRSERRCIRDLEAAGYLCAKSGGSLGLFDVIAIGSADVRLVQVKSGTNRLSRIEREAIKELKVPSNVSKQYWLYLDRVKAPIIEVL